MNCETCPLLCDVSRVSITFTMKSSNKWALLKRALLTRVRRNFNFILDFSSLCVISVFHLSEPFTRKVESIDRRDAGESLT